MMIFKQSVGKCTSKIKCHKAILGGQMPPFHIKSLGVLGRERSFIRTYTVFSKYSNAHFYHNHKALYMEV